MDKILSIQRTRDYYDDGNLDNEEFDKLYQKITKDLEFIENFKRAVPYLKETLTEQQFGIMQVLMDKESREILAYLATDNTHHSGCSPID